VELASNSVALESFQTNIVLTTTTEKELNTIINKKQTKEQAATPATGCLVVGEVQSIFVIVGVMEDSLHFHSSIVTTIIIRLLGSGGSSRGDQGCMLVGMHFVERSMKGTCQLEGELPCSEVGVNGTAVRLVEPRTGLLSSGAPEQVLETLLKTENITVSGASLMEEEAVIDNDHGDVVIRRGIEESADVLTEIPCVSVGDWSSKADANQMVHVILGVLHGLIVQE